MLRFVIEALQACCCMTAINNVATGTQQCSAVGAAVTCVVGGHSTSSLRRSLHCCAPRCGELQVHCITDLTGPPFAHAGCAVARRSEIVQLQAGAERQRRKWLSTAAVVGVTCCAALQVRLHP
jgi:hypothetical protein